MWPFLVSNQLSHSQPGAGRGVSHSSDCPTRESIYKKFVRAAQPLTRVGSFFSNKKISSTCPTKERAHTVNQVQHPWSKLVRTVDRAERLDPFNISKINWSNEIKMLLEALNNNNNNNLKWPIKHIKTSCKESQQTMIQA